MYGVAEVGAQFEGEVARQLLLAAKVVELVEGLAVLDARGVERGDDAAAQTRDRSRDVKLRSASVKG